MTLKRLYVNGGNRELSMQEMPPHVTFPLSGPVLDHSNFEGEESSGTASKANYP